MFKDDKPAKFFPIMDRTTLKVWQTDKLGYFDFYYPGGCALSLGTYGRKTHGVAFKFIKEGDMNIIEDYEIFEDAYVFQISESIPDEWIKERLLGGLKEYSTWPQKDALTCIEGKVPDNLADFYPFVLYPEDNLYFEGIEVQGKFSVRFLLGKPFKFLGYANKPKGRIVLYSSEPGNHRSPKHTEYDGPCYNLRIRQIAEFTYEALKDPNIKEMISKNSQ